MRVVLVGLVLLAAACSTAEQEFETYELGVVTKIATHCAAADPILSGSDPDGLPQLAQTEPDRVRAVLAESRAELIETYGAVDAVAAPRNGEVWSGPVGAATVRQVEDLLIVVELDGNALCPTAPVSWNGIPLAFFRAGSLD